MCVLIWTALLFYVRGISCDGAALKKSCHTKPELWSYCISLSEGGTTAEVGLCAVIPCSFTAAAQFNVTQLMWLKCGPELPIKCDTPESLNCNSSSRSAVFQSEFRGRVSLLEPDLSLNNCSIIINDLRESDSGSYQLRLGGYRNNKPDGFTFIFTATLRVTGLSQTPTVTVPPLTAGQQNTLTCTAPGLCSGSAPTFTWRWRKPGGTHSHITGNITAVNTENVSAVAQRHSSTLTFDLSAEHHGTEVTCKVSFTGDVETEETVTLNVSYDIINVLLNSKWLHVAFGFIIGILCSAAVVCLARRCHSNSRKKVEPDPEDRTYTSLQKRTVSPEYDVINQRNY